ncbi:MAG: lipase [Pseudomonadota bacterium]
MPQVRRRAVFFIGGYERKSHTSFFARLTKQVGLSAHTWQTTFSSGDISYLDDQSIAVGEYTMTGPDGARCDTRFHLLDLDDWVQADNARGAAARITHYLRSFSDYIVSGTAARFFTANWRFALYFLYPFATLIGSVLAGIFVTRLLGRAEFPGAIWVALFAGLASGFAVFRYLAARFFALHLMDLWSFSADYIRRRRAHVHKRTTTWGACVADCVASKAYDEVLLIGHSTGGAIILDVAAKATKQLEERGGAHPGFTIATIGSTSLKIGMHPAARWYADDIAHMEKSAGVRWFEYQALTDIINFYRCDPFEKMGLDAGRVEPFPDCQLVRFKHMLSADYYRRIKRNFLRVHYQFISGNTKPYFYDFAMICFGAMRLEDRFSFRYTACGMTDAQQEAPPE